MAPILGDLSQGEKLSEIKPPLVIAAIVEKMHHFYIATERLRDELFAV